MINFFSKIKTYTENFLDLFYPEFCAACNSNLVNQEKVLCTKCLYEMPKTNFHKIEGNPIEQIFWGRVPVEKASSLFFYKKESKYRKLIHKLKYQNQPEIGIEMGVIFAQDLISEPYFNSIDFIIPVPLHKKKQQIRGYNQSEMIAKGMAEILPADLNTSSLVRKVFTNTQTKKNRFERWENVGEVFGVNHPEKLDNKKILLVDDILTTGATLEGCAQAILNASNTKISIATLGYAYD